MSADYSVFHKLFLTAGVCFSEIWGGGGRKVAIVVELEETEGHWCWRLY